MRDTKSIFLTLSPVTGNFASPCSGLIESTFPLLEATNHSSHDGSVSENQKMSRHRSLVLTCGLFLAAALSAQASNIVVNGNFTDTTSAGLVGWTYNHGVWQKTNRASIAGGGAKTGCGAGDSCINDSGYGISQSLSTIPGGVYALTFWFNGERREGDIQAVFDGTAGVLPTYPTRLGAQVYDGTTLAFNATVTNIVLQSGVFNYDGTWQQVTVDGLVAKSTSTNLAFFWTGDWVGYVGQVSVVQTNPEPMSGLLLVSGLAGLVMWKRRKSGLGR